METPILKSYFTNPDNVAFASWTRDNPWKELFKMWDSDLEYCSVLFKKIVCVDWYEVSVQASYWHYCKPRRTFFCDWAFSYTHMELWFPSQEDELINEYAESSDFTQTVYPCVPVEVIEKLLEKHWWISPSSNRE